LVSALALLAAMVAGLFAGAAPALALSSNPAVVISQVYGGGGNSGATYTHDFVELFNRSNAPVSLAGWSIQYASATGSGSLGSSSAQLTELPNVTLQPGQYYLVQQGQGSGGTTPLPSPDLVDPTPIAMSATGGKVALANIATSLGCNSSSTCNAAQIAQIIDLVGWDGANFFEGSAAAPATINTTAVLRNGNGCTDTNNNSADFTAAAPAPRNTASPVNVCGAPPVDDAPTVTGTTPANEATGVATSENISVTFSEAVNVSTASFSLSCATTGAIAYSLNGGPSSYTLDPISDLPAGDTCSLTVNAASVTDQDANDPPDTMAADVTISFATETATPICEQTYTPIYAIQGSGMSAAITGNVTTYGVVVGDYEGANEVGIGGFYLQDPTGDGDPATSDGIFVYTGTAPGVNTVAAGDLVRVTGFARERFNETTLNGSNSNSAAVPAANIINCGAGSVTPTPIELPVPTSTYLERYEGMLVTLPQDLVISEYFNYDRFGEYVLALPIGSEERPYTPTAIETPGSPEYFARLDLNLRSRILIDDGLGSQNPAGGNTHPNGLPFSLENSFRGGDIVTDFTGVLGFGFSAYRIQPTTYGIYTATNPRPAVPEDVGGSLKVAAFNVLNYFLTLDDGTNDICGPLENQECRGADDAIEFDRQEDKIIAALLGIDADVVGLIEMENTLGVEPLARLVNELNAAQSDDTYDFIDTGVIGSDAIRVGLIYKSNTVTPVGDHAVLDSQAFVNPFNADVDRNRPAVAQTFAEINGGGGFTVVVNHLKSKGSGCGAGDDDLTTGQGNCNSTRTAAALALANWLATDPTGSGDPDVLIIGDLNSYAKEDPIVALETAGYTNLTGLFGGPTAYGYVFDGQFGYLDYAMSSASLTAQVTGVTDWHINADEVDLIDYDTTFKSDTQDGYFAPDAYRSSDHDPVIIGLALDGAPPTTTASVSGAAAPNCPSDCFFGSATVELSANEPASIFYSVNGSAFAPYAAPFAVTSIGSNTVEFYAVDTAGNTEATKSAIVKVVDFPGTTLLDDFNRANGRLGADWSGATSSGEYAIAGQQVDVGKGGQAAWRPDTFGADQEAFMRLTTIDPRGAHHTLMLKSRGVNSSQGAILVSYDAVRKAVIVEALAPGYGWRTVASYPLTLSDGVSIGARARADGTVEVYVDCILIGTADTRTVVGTTYVNQGGRIGVWFHKTSGATFDNFGGGDLE
jgi:hypothetical protein